jgi:tetratricopeptide (TPR) repeat protein
MILGSSIEAAVTVSAEVIDRIHVLYGQNRFLDAYALSQEIGPLNRWVGADARVMAGRLANNLGGVRLGTWHHVRAWQEEPGHANALYYYARIVCSRKGPYAGWKFIKSAGPLPDETHANIRGDWLALQGTIAAERPWVRVERAVILQIQDRHAEALEAARESMELREWFRPGVQMTAQLLLLLNRDAEALELLERAAAARPQSAPIVSHLAGMLTELKRHEEARRLWERVVELSPLADRDFNHWLAGRRSDAAPWPPRWPGRRGRGSSRRLPRTCRKT